MDAFDPAFLSLLPGFIALGCLVGFMAGLLGIGGGLILVPGLYYLLKHVGGLSPDDADLMHVALATSTAIIVPTGISSAMAQIKRGAVDWKAVRLMAPGLVLGVSVGVLLVNQLESRVLQYIFAFGLYGIAASFFLKKETQSPHSFLAKPQWAVPFTTAFGVFATMLGIGGAVLNVPYLTHAGFPLKTAIAAGALLGVVIALPATIGYIVTGDGAFGHIHIYAFLAIVPISVLMAPLGVKVSHALPVAKLRIAFIILLLCVATKMLIEVI